MAQYCDNFTFAHEDNADFRFFDDANDSFEFWYGLRGPQGPQGLPGPQGPPGPSGGGVLPGGTTGQIIKKLSDEDLDAGWVDFPSIDKGSNANGYAVKIADITAATASGDYAVTIGRENTASGSASVAIGRGNTASGNQGVALGRSCTASGSQSHAEGYMTTASGNYSHAEGYNCSAENQTAHAEGNGTRATANASRSAGYQTLASGVGANAEGSQTQATGNGSHAEGQSTVSSGSFAHAEGFHTQANHAAQLVYGKYNIPDPSAEDSTAFGDYVEIVGNGADANNLSNARTLDWYGNEVLAGKLTVGAQPTGNMDVATKGYVDNGTSGSTQAIPYGVVDGTSTSTAFTATVSGITELKDGTCVLLKNGVVTSASGFTINVNNLGAKPVYSNLASATAETTVFESGRTALFVYDSTRVTGGCWLLYRGIYDEGVAYRLRTQKTNLAMAERTYRYRLFFTSSNGKLWVPANLSTATNATSVKATSQAPINPFGEIVYYNATASVNSGTRPSDSVLFTQITLELGYSFNTTGAALTLTSWAPVYVKCNPLSNGSATIDANEPFVQALPTADDGKIYIFLGIAYDATHIELFQTHPVYYYSGNGIKLWTFADANSAFNGDVKNALVACFSHVTWSDSNGQQYLDNLMKSLYGKIPVSISAAYTQPGIVSDIDQLDSLNDGLVVTATYSDNSTARVPSYDYSLSGALTAGSSTITVIYGGLTDTFTVTVKHFTQFSGKYANGISFSFSGGMLKYWDDAGSKLRRSYVLDGTGDHTITRGNGGNYSFYPIPVPSTAVGVKFVFPKPSLAADPYFTKWQNSSWVQVADIPWKFGDSTIDVTSINNGGLYVAFSVRNENNDTSVNQEDTTDWKFGWV